jgi:hypothetical protein
MANEDSRCGYRGAEDDEAKPVLLHAGTLRLPVTRPQVTSVLGINLYVAVLRNASYRLQQRPKRRISALGRAQTQILRLTFLGIWNLE